FFLEGRAEGVFDGESYELGPGDVAFAGVGCVHSFRNLGGGPLRWLETQAPQPPGRHSYRFRRDWEYLTATLKETQRVKVPSSSSVGPRDSAARFVVTTWARVVRWCSPAGTRSGPRRSPPNSVARPAGSGSTSPSRTGSPTPSATWGRSRTWCSPGSTAAPTR